MFFCINPVFLDYYFDPLKRLAYMRPNNLLVSTKLPKSKIIKMIHGDQIEDNDCDRRVLEFITGIVTGIKTLDTYDAIDYVHGERKTSDN